MLSPYIAEQEIIRRFNRTRRNLKEFSNNSYSGNQLSLFFLYQSLLGRSLSGNELEYFLKTARKTNPKNLTKLILYSCESLLRNPQPPKPIYSSIYEILKNSADSFVENIFMLMLGRSPNPSELQIWNKRLKYTNRFIVFIMFLRVNEYKQSYKFIVISEASFKIIYKIKMHIFSFKYFIKGNPSLFNKLLNSWK